jgi:large subunit ribosomal protein L1
LTKTSKVAIMRPLLNRVGSNLNLELLPRNLHNMAKKSKRMTESLAKIDKTRTYSLDEAIQLVKETGKVKFDASVEVHFRMGIDPKKSDQQIRATVALPHGTGKTLKIAAFVEPGDEATAKAAGADLIMGEDEIKELKKTGKIEFDVAVATPGMMPKIAMVAKILGPRGLMPNPKTSTVGPDVAKMVEALKKGQAAFKNDDTANIHQIIGKVSFEDTQIRDNFIAMTDALKKVRPNSAKGAYVKAVYLTSAMGPSVKVAVDF